MRLLKPAAIALIMMAGPALAGSPGATTAVNDPIPPAPALHAGHDWSGAYAGLQFGYIGATHQGWRFPSINQQYNGDPTGFGAGAFIGYNWQPSQRFVFGIEAEINASRASNTRTMLDSVRNEIPGSNVRGRSDISLTSALRLRFGLPFDRTMPYVAIGAAQARYRLTWLNGNAVQDRVTTTVTGVSYGLGVEHAVTERWRVRGEARYTDFGRRNIRALPGGTPASRTRLIMTEFNLGLAYRF